MSAPSSRLYLGLLALWLGFWPAADAVTGASRVMVVLTDASPIESCCGGCDAQSRAEEARGCGGSAAEESSGCDTPCNEARASRCAAKSSRCVMCAQLGGMVLFAAPWDGIDHQMRLFGLAVAHSEALISTHLQPPVPPPWLLS